MPKDANGLLDLVIVGAGIYGICAASTYLTFHPEANIRVLDSDTNVGGVWSSSRLYPQFWSQTGARLAGFPDKPFRLPEGAENYHDLFESRYLAQYLEKYVDEHVYDGRGLRERFVFGCWVRGVEKVGDVWTIEADLKGDEKVVYKAQKLVIATGNNSLPNTPSLLGQDSFHGPILHQKNFGRSKILTPSEPNMEDHTHITILGGSKSAADIVYAAATDANKERKVSWIVRTSGSGPVLMTAVQGFGKFRNLPETGSTRAIASLSSANPFLPESWWSWFLQRTWVGEWLLETLWKQTEVKSAAVADFEGREGRLEGFGGLKSETVVRWRSGPIGLLQREDFWDVVAKKVRVHRADVKELREGCVVLENGEEVRTDVLLCATGWKQEYGFFSVGESARLGLPIPLSEHQLAKEEREQWSRLEADADQKVLQRWPYLANNSSKFKPRPQQTTSYKLYNMTIPPDDRTIAFLGQILVPNSYHVALVQTLYAIAVLDGKLALPSLEEMKTEIAFLNRWCRHRYPVHGFMGNVLDFEMVSFTDRLLDILGLSSHRTGRSWWSDLTDPTLASDYAGLVDEYRRKYGA